MAPMPPDSSAGGRATLDAPRVSSCQGTSGRLNEAKVYDPVVLLYLYDNYVGSIAGSRPLGLARLA